MRTVARDAPTRDCGQTGIASQPLCKQRLMCRTVSSAPVSPPANVAQDRLLIPTLVKRWSLVTTDHRRTASVPRPVARGDTFGYPLAQPTQATRARTLALDKIHPTFRRGRRLWYVIDPSGRPGRRSCLGYCL